MKLQDPDGELYLRAPFSNGPLDHLWAMSELKPSPLAKHPHGPRQGYETLVDARTLCGLRLARGGLLFAMSVPLAPCLNCRRSARRLGLRRAGVDKGGTSVA